MGCAARFRSRVIGRGPFPRSLPPNPAGTFRCTGLSGDYAVALRRTASTVSAFCIPHTSWLLKVRHLCPSPCGPALPVSRLAGRYSCDYYGHSVAIGLAPRRRSHVHQRCMYQRDLGVPFVSFNTRTGHRSSAPEDRGRFVVTLSQGPVPVSGVFPAGVILHLLETGIQAIQLSPYHADPPARRSLRLDTTAGLLACYFPRPPFRITGQPSDPETSPPSLPATRAIQSCTSWRSYNAHRPHRALNHIHHAQHRLFPSGLPAVSGADRSPAVSSTSTHLRARTARRAA